MIEDKATNMNQISNTHMPTKGKINEKTTMSKWQHPQYFLPHRMIKSSERCMHLGCTGYQNCAPLEVAEQPVKSHVKPSP